MRYAALVSFTILFYSCSKVPISQRRQMHLLKESTLIDMAALQYANFMDSVNLLTTVDPRAKRIAVIGNKIKMQLFSFWKRTVIVTG